ncbi:L-lactate dehydrogenase B chain [Fukomys damarensis]|uniref:L-lactate dehydrogenase B chain n=1 Tax=Fukomys damarensis TaxID=885580 RepID=A0A091CNW5_FUKDA|nr:L-lactate dehydrogenase B chain [Fukomys damarensis]
MGMDNDSENWKEGHMMVTESACEVTKLKGYTKWVIGLSVADLVESVLKPLFRIHPVLAVMKSTTSIENEIFLSLPCSLDAPQLTSAANKKLNDEQVAQFKKSADTSWDIQKGPKDS